MRGQGFWLLLTSVVLSEALGTTAHAETYELTYRGAPGCPTDAAFRADALAHVRDTSTVAFARVEVSVEVRKHGFHGELSATDEEGHVGHRAIDGATCADVAHALAFLAGLAIELGGRLERPPSPPTPPSPPPPSPPPPPPPAPAPARPPPPRSRGLVTSMALLGELRTGLAPIERPAAELAFDLEDGRARVVAPALRVAVMGTRSELSTPSGSATLRILGGRVEGCPLRLGNRRLGVHPCLAFELAHVWAESHAPTNRRDRTLLWSTAEAVARVKWRILGGLFVESDLAVGAPLVRPRYFFQPDRVLYEVPSVTVRAALGLGYAY